MATRLILLATGAAMALTPAASPAQSRPAATAPVMTAPLIPREALFGNPTKAGGQLSPDGKWLLWLAPVDGVLNVWLAPIATPDKGRAITASTDRPIRQAFWSPDSRSVLYVQDKGGDENFLLYGVDVASGKERTLTPFEKTRAQVVAGSTLHKDRILVGLNNRDARYHDIHSLDLNSGELKEVLRNDSYAGFVADNNLDIRMAVRPNAAGGQDFFRVADNTVEDKPFASTTLDDALTTSPAGYTTDGKTLYWIDSRDRNTAALFAEDVASGERRLVAQSDRADVGRVLANPKTGVVEAWSINYLKPEWTASDPKVKASLDLLRSKLDGEFSVVSRTDADDLWLIGNDPVTGPTRTWLLNRKTNALTPLYISRPELAGAPLQPMHTVAITARDGLTLPSYLTLPPGSDADGDGRPDTPVPMVLYVHGGPWARDGYGSNPTHQWLANRGYAVLSTNFRGSTGFGKSFIAAGNLEWGAKMQDDLSDAVAWAVKQGVTTSDKVAIMGGSYGGYATLAGLAFRPQEYACGVDIVGPSNLETLLKTIPPYWEPVVRQFHDRMGNPNTPEGLAMLKDRSPLYKAGDIVRPLLIGQGANDPRVNKAESDQIVDALKAKGIPVTYVLFPDEGHGFARPQNNIAFNAVAETFLARCLGGRAEPVGTALSDSTGQVLAGAGYIGAAN